MQNNAKKFVKIAFGLPLTIISIGFITNFIYEHRSQIPPFSDIHWPLFLLGTFFLLLFYLVRSLVWFLLIKNQTKNLSSLDAIYFLSLGELRRYIPGSILAFISRGVYFKPYGLTSKEIPHLLIQESIIFAASAAFLSIPAFLFFKKNVPENIENTILPLLILGLLIGGIYMYFRMRKLGKNQLFSFANIQIVISAFLTACLGWIFFGYGNFFIANSLIPLDYYRALYLISFFIFAWLVGFLSFLTPMGLGVREGTIVFFLTRLFSVGVASAIALWLRLATIISELIFLLIVWTCRKIKINTLFKYSWEEFSALGLGGTYSIYFSLVTLAKHERFYTGKYDLGNMAHVLYHTAHGNIFQHTDAGGTEIVSRLATHADFILILLSPFAYVFDPSKFLLVFQSLALGTGVFIVFKLAQLLTKNNGLALLFSVSYSFNFWVQKQNLFDFHPVTLATPLLLLVFYFLFKKKIPHMIVSLILALLTKEQMYAVGFLVGGYMVFFKKIKIGYIIMPLSLIIFYLLMNVFIPQTKTGGHFALSYFNQLGSSPTEIVLNVFLKPQIIFSLLFSEDRIEYLKLVFQPLGILPLFGPIFLIGALPDLLINLVSNNHHLRNINYHYGAVIIPFMYIAAITGAAFLTKKKVPVFMISMYLISTIIYSSYQHGVLPGMKNPNTEMFRPITKDEKALHKFLSTIPATLNVSASNNIGPHLVNRDNIYVYPVGVDEAQIIVISKVDANASPNLKSHLKDINEMKTSSRFDVIFENSIATIFTKRSVIAR